MSVRTVCTLLLVAFLRGAQAQVMTEREAVKAFLSESPQTRELRAGVAAVEAETRGWSLWSNPAATYSREGASVNQFWQIGQQIPLSGRLGYLRQAGTAAVAAARLRSDFEVWQLVNDVRAAFYGIVAAQNRETAIQSNLDGLIEIIRVLSEREKQGEGSLYDRLRAEREKAEVESQLGAFRVATAEARARLAGLLPAAVEPSALVVSGEPGFPGILPPASELCERALAIRGDYTSQHKEIQQYQSSQHAAERLRIPEPTVTAGFNRAQVGENTAPGSYVEISVPLPIFNKGKTEVARFQAETDRTEAHRRAIEQQILAQVKGARSALELRRRAEEQYRRSLETQGQRLEQIAQTAYQEGELDILALLDAWRVSLGSRLRLLELDAAAKQAEIELERFVGEPVLNKGILP
jgi:outer membrane protein, heavy metal efflux system